MSRNTSFIPTGNDNTADLTHLSITIQPPLASKGSRLTSCSRVFFFLYLLLALFYTFCQTLAHPFLSFVSGSSPKAPHDGWGSAGLSYFPADSLEHGHHQYPDSAASSGKREGLSNIPQRFTDSATGESLQSLEPVLWKDYGRMQGVEWDQEIIQWIQSADSQYSTLPMSEDFFLSKAFGESLQPSKVIPYYYRASNPVQKKDITITTLVTSNRLTVLAQLADKYQGRVYGQ